MLTKASLKIDIAHRIKKVQSMMRDQGVDALIIAGAAAPGSLGAIRYLTNAHLWGGSGYVVLGVNDPDPWLLAWSSYQALWSRNETTTLPERVESPENLLSRCADIAKSYLGDNNRVGFINSKKVMSVGDYEAFQSHLKGFEFIELTAPFNAIRQIKTPFEIEACFQNGTILDASLNIFQEQAKVGKRYWDVCAEVEAYVKAQGAFWGRTKVSLDRTPYTVPTDKNQKIQREDIINFEIVYESPFGYWLEMTTVFSFDPLPEYEQTILDAYLAAVDASSALAKEGNTFKDISDANDKTIASFGLKVIGKHTPDCHSTGLDGADGPSSFADPDFVLRNNMVLSYHPGTVLEKNHGFLVSDNFLVTPEGAVRLSPHHAQRYHLLLNA